MGRACKSLLVGNILHTADSNWLASPQRKDDYGDLMYLTVFGQGILVINSQCVAIDLLEKRSNIYSDCPQSISLNEFLTESLLFVFTGYGNLWRRLHHPAVEGFSKSVVPDFYPIQGREAIMLALSLIKSPPMIKHFQ
ncbi:hypothetical protein EDB89DRAFT_1851324 [Lactarius sanguifluus]|nr:hypothetical protein EDB89DRAFT_1851324 [Lactarius sanguifluus]